MEITLKDGETLTVKGEKGVLGPYVVVLGMDGGAVNRTDTERNG